MCDIGRYKTKETNMKNEKFTLRRDGMMDLEITGERLAFVSDQRTSGDTNDRFTERTVYKTAGGKYVIHHEYITMWQNESGNSSVKVFDTLKEVEQYLNPSDDEFYLSDEIKYLLKELGLKTTVTLDE